jgi:hypothetical protein
MANPNIIDVISIHGKTSHKHLTTDSEPLLQNVLGSNSVYKINTVLVSNSNGSINADVSLVYYDKNIEDGSYIAKTREVLADSTLVLISKDISLYLEENCDLKIFASANGNLDATISYEVIS